MPKWLHKAALKGKILESIFSQRKELVASFNTMLSITQKITTVVDSRKPPQSTPAKSQQDAMQKPVMFAFTYSLEMEAINRQSRLQLKGRLVSYRHHSVFV